MNNRRFRGIIALLIAGSVFWLTAPRVEACGPFSLGAIFTYSVHPDMPLDAFVQGRLGVIQPSYARSYLFAAYRQLLGLEFDQKEQRALLELWKERLSGSWDDSEDDWIKPWLEARAKVPGAGAAPKIGAYRQREKPNDYEGYLNCQPDAFATAAATLSDRLNRFGTSTAAIKEWVAAQDAVFANCAEGQTLPGAASTTQDAWLRLDREYQTAAANFYAGRFPEAKDQFAAISRNRESPWRQTAGYMIARTSLRQASLGKTEERQSSLSEAESKLQQILKDKELSSQHHASGRLLNLVRLRLRPEEKLHELSNAILQRGAGEGLKQDVWDYTFLLDRFLGEDVDDASDRKAIPASITADDITDWIVTMQKRDGDSLEHALQKLKNSNALPWLVAALTKVNAKHPQADPLLQAAGRINRASPGFASVSFHRVRLLMDGGKYDAARTISNGILDGDRKHLTASALNLFLSQRMMLARNISEFLRDAPRTPAGFSYDEDGREFPADPAEIGDAKPESSLLFDGDAVAVFNEKAPLSVLVTVATSNTLPAHLRRDVSQAAWLRAALLDRPDDSARVATVLLGFYPELREFTTAYQSSNTPAGRRFAATYLALKFPGLRPTVTAGAQRSGPINEIDSYRDNWWCLAGSSQAIAAAPEGDESKTQTRQHPVFLSPAEVTTARSEVTTLNALGSGPNYLSRTAIEWAGRKPADTRIPEALHLAVTSTRRGCTDKETGRWSKAAFDLLHRRYPNNSWTEKTKYWFKD